MKKILMTITAGAMLLSAQAYESFGAAFSAGQTALKKKDYDTAAKCFAEAHKLAQKPGNRCDALFYEGIVLCESGKTDDGVARIHEAVKCAPSVSRTVTLQYHIGHYLQKSGRIDEAVAELKKARSLDPKAPMADSCDNFAAKLLMRAGKNEEAEKLLHSVVNAPAAEDGKINALCQLLTLSYVMKKDPAPIVAQLEQSRAKNGNTEVARCERLWDYYLRTRQKDKAMVQAKQLQDNVTLTGVQRDHGTYYLARYYQFYTTDKAKAVECWKKIVNSKNAYIAKQAKTNLKKLEK